MASRRKSHPSRHRRQRKIKRHHQKRGRTREDTGDAPLKTTKGPKPLKKARIQTQRHPAKVYQFITQNVNGAKEKIEADGTRTNEKFETIAHQMVKHKKQAYLIQETWMTGNFITEIQGIRFFHHGLDESTCNRGRGGVAIALGPEAYDAWVEAGMPQPTMLGDMGDGCARVMSMDLNFEEKGDFRKISLINVYAPHAENKTEDEIRNFYDQVKDITDECKRRGREVIIGGDFNACVGTRNECTEMESQAIGPHGNKQRNMCGDMVIDLAVVANLKVATSFFPHNHYSTFKDNRNDVSRQLDYFLTDASLGTKVTDAKKTGKEIGCRSDHGAVSLTVRFGYESSERRTKREEKKNIKWSELDDPATKIKYQAKVDELLEALKEEGGTLNSESLSEALMKAGKATCEVKQVSSKGWFEMSAESLTEAIEARNLAHADDVAQSSCETKRVLREAWKGVRTAKKEAIAKWVRETSKDIQSTIMARNPKRTWKQVRVLEAGLTGHHKQARTKRYVNTSGVEAMNDREDVENASEHFQKVYNRDDAPVDFSVLEDIKQREMLPELEREPEMLELVSAIKAMRGEAAPGESGVVGNCLKHCSAEALESILGVLTRFWNGEQDNHQWHLASLCIIYKGKGKLNDLNNFRGVALQDMMARLISAIISKRLLDGPIAKYGIQAQFGSQPLVGCRDAIFTLRSMLELRRYHNLPTWALYVDLVKAFDTANHELLFKLLAKYGVPEHLVDVIRRLYHDSEIKLKVGREERTIPYSVGVKQGDNMAPVLFLFLMQAMAEALEKEWAENDIDVPQFRHFANRQGGRLLGQGWRAKGKLLELYYLLYVDDGAFLFTNRKDTITASRLIHRTMARFGLIMHIGRDGNKSKTEAMYHPPSYQESKEQKEEVGEIPEEALYTVADGYITFTRKFKYLGSWITHDLRDDTDINVRVGKARAQVQQLANIWNCKHVTTEFKKMLYIQLPLNTALWGAESWTLTAESERKLETFHHSSIRRIMNVTMFEVEERRITNKQMRETFDNIRNISEFIKERQLTWLEHVLQMDPTKNTRKLVNAWIQHPRRGGQPQHNLRHSYRKALIAVGEITEDDTQAPFKKWVSRIEDLPEGTSWKLDVRKRLRKWNSKRDAEKANERRQRRETEEEASE
jgi:exonuclease III